MACKISIRLQKIVTGMSEGEEKGEEHQEAGNQGFAFGLQNLKPESGVSFRFGFGCLGFISFIISIGSARRIFSKGEAKKLRRGKGLYFKAQILEQANGWLV